MKYIKQYEAFDASILTNILEFLKKKSIANLEAFKVQFKNISSSLDTRMDKIKGSDIKYLKYKDALNLIGDDDKLKYIKFWFSSENGYISFTGTSNIKRKIIDNGHIKQSLLDELSKKNNIKGELTKVSSPSELQTGDYIVLGIGYFGESGDSSITIARVYIENNFVYAIQNIKEGSHPNRGNWRDYGRYGWSIAQSGTFSPDHHLLRKIKIDDKFDTLEYLDSDYSSEFEWNLPLDFNLNLLEWDLNQEPGYYDDDDEWVETTQVDSELDKIKNNADFAIVIDIQNIDRGELSNIRNIRKDIKKDAIALLSNEEVRKINLERYFEKIFDKYGFTTGSNKVNSLNSLINVVLCRDLVFLSTSKSYRFNSLVNLLTSILINGASDNSINQIRDIYKRGNDEYNNLINKKYDGISKTIQDKYLELGKRFSKMILSLDITNSDEVVALNSIIRTLNSYHEGYINIDNPTQRDLDKLAKFESVFNIIVR